MKGKSWIALATALCGLCLSAGCGKEESMKLAPEREWLEVNTYSAEAYLRPYWYTREIYNETCLFVGEEGEATLLFTPEEVRSVRSYTLDTVYEEGKDYEIEGRTIRRLKGSAIPYFEPDEYFRKEPDTVAIGADMSKVEFDFEEPRYLKYGEQDTFTSRQIAVTYRHAEAYDGPVPASCTDKTENFRKKLVAGGEVSVMVYGDSVAVGCNASGSEYGGNTAPHMPVYGEIICSYLEEKYGVTVNYFNEAVGGWTTADCLGAYDQKIKGKALDLLILRVGGNDGGTLPELYEMGVEGIVEKYFADNPDGVVILQSSERPNMQSSWVGNQKVFEENLDNIAASRDNVAVAHVESFFTYMESRGKRTRDFLGNNINHANDFGIRAYPQIILKTLLGDEFCEEVWE